MPVSIEFSIARRKLVSWTSAAWIWLRRRMWRQVPSSIHRLRPDSASTIQKRVLPTKLSDVGQPCTRSDRPLDTGTSGTCASWVGERVVRPGAGVTLLATTRCSASTIWTLWRRVTSEGTARRSSRSTEYSTIRAPWKSSRCITGICSCSAALPVLSRKIDEYTGTRSVVSRWKVASLSFATEVEGRVGTACLPSGLTSRWNGRSEKTARTSRRAPTQAMCESSGRSSTSSAAWSSCGCTLWGLAASSRAMRATVCSFSLSCRRNCCWAISASRSTDCSSRCCSS